MCTDFFYKKNNRNTVKTKKYPLTVVDLLNPALLSAGERLIRYAGDECVTLEYIDVDFELVTVSNDLVKILQIYETHSLKGGIDSSELPSLAAILIAFANSKAHEPLKQDALKLLSLVFNAKMAGGFVNFLPSGLGPAAKPIVVFLDNYVSSKA